MVDWFGDLVTFFGRSWLVVVVAHAATVADDDFVHLRHAFHLFEGGEEPFDHGRSRVALCRRGCDDTGEQVA